MEALLINAIMAALGKSMVSDTTELSVEKVKGWFSKARESVPGTEELDSDQVEQLAQQMIEKGCMPIGPEMSRRNLARWFEVPEEEFVRTPSRQLEPEVLIRHIYLERLFATWLEEWGYLVERGEDLEGLEDIDFIPDVYGITETLHGDFEMVISLVCDDPPSINRARALFETFEAYARKDSPFGERDVYLMVTPFRFGRGVQSSISLQNREEDYTVLQIEGNDIWRLFNARDKNARLLDLKKNIERSQEISDQAKKSR